MMKNSTTQLSVQFFFAEIWPTKAVSFFELRSLLSFLLGMGSVIMSHFPQSNCLHWLNLHRLYNFSLCFVLFDDFSFLFENLNYRSLNFQPNKQTKKNTGWCIFFAKLLLFDTITTLFSTCACVNDYNL